MAGLNNGGSVQVASQPSNWLFGQPPENLSDFQRSILHTDWNNTHLGPIKQWPQQLLQMVMLTIADPNPAAVCWGRNSKTTTIRNEAYTNILNPDLASVAAKSLGLARDWYDIESVVQKHSKDPAAVIFPERLVLLKQKGMHVEAYISWRFTPIIDSSGFVVGSLSSGIDVTLGIVASRRLKTITSLSHAITAVEPAKDLWPRLVSGLQHISRDITTAMLYSTSEALSDMDNSPIGELSGFSMPPLTYTLKGSMGDSVKYLKVPVAVQLTNDESWLATSFTRAITIGDFVHLSVEDGTMPTHLSPGTDPMSQDSKWSRILICPLRSSNCAGSVGAFLVLTLPSWRPYDNDYQSFIRTLVNQIGPNYMVATTSTRKLPDRGELVESEDIEKANLALELQTRTLEVEEGERKLARFTTRAQVALGILDATGTVVFANPLWRDLTQLQPADTQVAWAKAIIPEDLEETYAIFARMVSESAPVDFYLRFNKRWQAPELDRDGNPIVTDTHIICNLFPDLDSDGNVTTIMSCLTDISEYVCVDLAF